MGVGERRVRHGKRVTKVNTDEDVRVKICNTGSLAFILTVFADVTNSSL